MPPEPHAGEDAVPHPGNHRSEHRPEHRPHALSRIRHRTLPIMLALLGLLATYPLVDTPGKPTPLAATALFAAVPLFGVCMLSHRLWIVVSMILAFAATASLIFLSGGDTEHALGSWGGVLVLVFYAVATAAIARAVFASGGVLDDRVYGGVAVYIMLGIIFAVIFHRTGVRDPGAFTRTLAERAGQPLNWADYLYLSFVTLTTMGYGDIVPSSSSTRSLAILEGLVGILFPPVLIARLVKKGT